MRLFCILFIEQPSYMILDYVSDYQLKSACKDAICIAPSKVTQMIFAVLED